MKKGLKYLSILFALILVITGCGKKDKKEESKSASNDDFAAAVEKTSNVKGFKMNAKADIKVSAQGQEMPMSLSMNGDVYSDLEKPSAHINGTIDLGALGGKQDVELYTNVKDGKIYTYSKTENQWTVDTQDYNKEQTNKVNKEEILNKIKDAKEIEKVDSDKDGYTKYQIKVTADKINEALKTAGSAAGTDMKVDSDFKLDVYVKDGYVSIISIDLGDLFKEMLKSSGTNMDVTAKMTIEFSDFDKVSEIVVPESVVSTAKADTTGSNSMLDFIK